MSTVSLDQLSFAAFKNLLNTRFRVHLSPAPCVELDLTEATLSEQRAAGSPDAPGRECFSLVFSGPASRPLMQRTYLFEHEKLGAFELFVVPIGVENGRVRYQAIFNRTIPAA